MTQSNGADHPSVRLLFAVIEELSVTGVNVKIDWERVAQSPILISKIPRGHAARMRFTRLRAAVMGEESEKKKKKPREAAPKANRVTKRTARGRKARASFVDDDDDGDVDGSGSASTLGPNNIKEESRFRFSPEGSLPPPSFPRHTPGFIGDFRSQSPSLSPTTRMNMRLLTPASDSDVLSSTQASGFMSSSPPPSDLTRSETSFEYITPPPGTVSHRDQSPWHQNSPAFSAYGMNSMTSSYDFDSYQNSYCDSHATAAAEMINAGRGQLHSAYLSQQETSADGLPGVVIKNEDCWDPMYQV